MIQQLLDENRRIRSKIPSVLEALMDPHIQQVDKCIQPGWSKMTWTSVNISEYIDNVYKRLGELELLTDRVNDLVEFRINAVLRDMSTTALCELPDEEPWAVDEFLERTQVCVVAVLQNERRTKRSGMATRTL